MLQIALEDFCWALGGVLASLHSELYAESRHTDPFGTGNLQSLKRHSKSYSGAFDWELVGGVLVSLFPELHAESRHMPFLEGDFVVCQ